MNRLFNMNSPFWQFMSKITDLLILNVIFVISCIPVITIGTAISSLYYMCLKLKRNESPYIWKGYWKAFRENFKQSTIIWLVSLVIIYFLGMDYSILKLQESNTLTFSRGLIWLATIIFFSIFIYIFPIVSHFHCTIRQAVKNSFYMALGHLPFTILLIVIFGGIIFLTTITPGLTAMIMVLGILCGFSVVTYLVCGIFNHIFKKYEPS